MKKPKPITRTHMEWHSMQTYIEKKYGCDLCDFAAYKHNLTKEKYPYGTISYNCNHEQQWKERNFPRLLELQKNPLPNYAFNQEGMDYYNSIEGYKWFTQIHESYEKAKDGKRKELPHHDFWNYLVDRFSISNGAVVTINWREFKSECKKEWQKEICDLFIREFGDKDMDIEFSW